MGKKEDYESKTEKLLQPIVDELNIEIYDVEYVKEAGEYYLRAYIDKEGSVDIDDCVNVSRKLEQKLDELDFIPDAYILEVSSPGLGRQLKKEKHFLKSIGLDVDLKLYKAVDGQKEFTGTLISYQDDKLVIRVDESEKEFELSQLARVNLHVEW
ncbi:MAG: ribosome maturation factor RimP [Lachnospiraceae bacterium]|nr:ribosome maturation factor RimP [Lachnospiraceae bacterium]